MNYLPDPGRYSHAAYRRCGRSGLIYTDREGQEHLLPADAVLCAVGMRARTGVMEELWNVVDEQYVIGDCVKPAQVTQAISDAYYLAKSL